MGCFDTVRFQCPICWEPFSLQSKSGECSLKEYSWRNAPANVLTDLIGTTWTCKRCATELKINGKLDCWVEYDWETEPWNTG